MKTQEVVNFNGERNRDDCLLLFNTAGIRKYLQESFSFLQQTSCLVLFIPAFLPGKKSFECEAAMAGQLNNWKKKRAIRFSFAFLPIIIALPSKACLMKFYHTWITFFAGRPKEQLIMRPYPPLVSCISHRPGRTWLSQRSI